MKGRILVALLLVVLSVVFFWALPSSSTPENVDAQGYLETQPVPAPPPTARLLFGIDIDAKVVVQDTVKPNQNLSEILMPFKVPNVAIHQVATQGKKVFDVRRIAANKPYTLICNPADSTAQQFIYQPNAYEFVVMDFTDSVEMRLGTRKIDTVVRSQTGIIETSLYDAVLAQGGSPALVNELFNVFSWEIDFFRIPEGDSYKVYYEQYLIDGQPIGTGQVLAAVFNHYSDDIYAIGFDQGEGIDYFDLEGASLRKAFMRAPLEYTRISSRYNPRRFHPVQKRFKAHLGTDYAAPRGTPIMSIGDGVVVQRGYTRGNGNYVKIRHNAHYTTQYLHMSRFNNSVKKGTRVKRGQVIGYVGKTGLATGNHLCFRFWLDGRQVDFLRVKLPPSNPIRQESKTAYEQTMQVWQQKLDALTYPAPPVLTAQTPIGS